MKYVLAVLNSSVAQFVFEKCFHSVKVLRSHLEQIPIPVADSGTQGQIVTLVEQLLVSEVESEDYSRIERMLDRIIVDLYGLTEEEYRMILHSL